MLIVISGSSFSVPSNKICRYLICRRQRHILHMMYNLKLRRPELLDTRDKKIDLRSSKKINFKEERLNSEVYINNPYVRGCNLWKKLPFHVQAAKTKKEFEIMLTDDILESLN